MSKKAEVLDAWQEDGRRLELRRRYSFKAWRWLLYVAEQGKTRLTQVSWGHIPSNMPAVDVLAERMVKLSERVGALAQMLAPLEPGRVVWWFGDRGLGWTKLHVERLMRTDPDGVRCYACQPVGAPFDGVILRQDALRVSPPPEK